MLDVAAGLTIDGPRLSLALARGSLPDGSTAAGASELAVVGGAGVPRRPSSTAGRARQARRGREDGAGARRAGSYLEPFALRALGRISGDDRLLDRAAAGFRALGLAWHAALTRGA